MRAGSQYEISYAPGTVWASGTMGQSQDKNKTALSGPARAKQAAALSEAVSVAKNSDVVVVALGEDPAEVGEGKDRADLDLSPQQQTLIKAVMKTGKPVVAVLFNGRPICIDWVAAHVPAIVEGWFGGEKSGLSLADILLGNINPSGKLPVTFPRSVGQIPFYYAHKPTSYHRYVDESDTPLYAFGHGLSYSTFAYSHLVLPTQNLDSVGNLQVEVTVKNTGKVKGTEIVQLYIRDKVSSVTTPVKALKAFSRVALEPGASQNVVFNLPIKETLGLWNRDMNNVVEPGDFEIMVGSSSRDIRLQGDVQVK